MCVIFLCGLTLRVLPYFSFLTYNLPLYLYSVCRAVIRLLLGDYLRLLQMKNANDEEVLYTEAELQSCIEKIELIDYHTTITVKGLSFHALNAGHVLGACMFWMEIGGRTVLYTGDYSTEDDRHLMAAEKPDKKPDLLIVESTYGVQVHASRAEREARFTGTIERVVTRGGRCLIPVFALGRAQVSLSNQCVLSRLRTCICADSLKTQILYCTTGIATDP